MQGSIIAPGIGIVKELPKNKLWLGLRPETRPFQ
jgi:hypothetical protein